ncbi:hypothetical protein [endosymbiont GvMRE of Glomus versiforme]|uniref:hypothetical protein n=1 Tax=endosymbiont GvMRE of Glomus versiforme TaxID=2039283 RepID=UPI000EBB6475|nr:hypothetical protein [endosymbiont GvMRE of Glomus versiforme]RHZ37750.1 hypothetical protein GvMRE_I1g535 [endosymbiont GvMRE of Glomus versiforme]
MEKESQLIRQEKIELLKKAIGKETCFLCFRHVFLYSLKEGREEIINGLSLCLKCANRYRILRSLEEKCECGCEKCKC